MPVTQAQMDELIRQMKIANQLRLSTFMYNFKIRPVECTSEKEATNWSTLIEEVSDLANYLNI